MPSYRSTITPCLGLVLLAAIALYIGGDEPVDRGEQRALNGEKEIKAVVPAPDTHDHPAADMPCCHSKTGWRDYASAPAFDPPFARTHAGNGTQIRGPPAAHPVPA